VPLDAIEYRRLNECRERERVIAGQSNDAALGIAVAQDGDTADTLLPRADADMYARKGISRV